MLILLADTRKKLLRLWIIATVALVLLVFAQTLAGKFEDIESTAWTWVFVQLLPTFVLLFVAVLLNKNPSKVLPHETFQAVYIGGVAYLLLVLITLLVLPDVARHWSIESYLRMSYDWLLPLQAILWIVFGLLYFRKETFFRPNAAIMQEYVAKKSEFAQRTGHLTHIQAFALLIQDDGVGKALAFLQYNSINKSNDLILLQGQYATWQQQRDLNLLAPDVLQRELNRMTIVAIDVIEAS